MTAREMAAEIESRMIQRRRGMIVAVSSPSGAGKSTILSRLLALEGRQMTASVSVTTRGRRGAEIEGRHYHFVDREVFAAMAADGQLLEHAEVHGNLYGTRRAPVEAALAAGLDVVMDIDWQGRATVAAAMAADVVSIFILPPSLAELRRRLVGRAEDAEETIERRIANARGEIAQCGSYDYVLVNEDLEETCTVMAAIIATERLRAGRTLERTADLLLRLGG